MFCMQNADHLRFVLENLNQLPQRADRTDFSRVRTWNLNNWSSPYRQTLLLSRAVASPLPDLTWIWRVACRNHSGSYKIRPSTSLMSQGGISRVVSAARQTFQRLPEVMSTNERDSKLISDPDDVRFEFFTQNIIPDILRSTGTRCEQP